MVFHYTRHNKKKKIILLTVDVELSCFLRQQTPFLGCVLVALQLLVVEEFNFLVPLHNISLLAGGEVESA